MPKTKAENFVNMILTLLTSVNTGCEELIARNVIYKWQVGLLRWAKIEEGEKATQGEKEGASSKRPWRSQFNKLVLPHSLPPSFPSSLPALINVVPFQ